MKPKISYKSQKNVPKLQTYDCDEWESRSECCQAKLIRLNNLISICDKCQCEVTVEGKCLSCDR